ncbi:hypothetical protein Tco_0894636 [Tanacetum coccineum]|uniref:Uncharacterized protein n=1 Tax=Tanacetum coccineum TaxID=301880 RepID=A0ABQ5CIL4_9ASTR
MLWGIVTQTNVDHADDMGRFTKGSRHFFSHKVSHKKAPSLKKPNIERNSAAQYSRYERNTKKTPQESASVQPATKRATPKKPTTTTPVKQSKPAPPPTKKPSKRKLPQKVRKGKPTFQLVDEDDEAQQESIPQEEDDDPDLELAKKMSLEAHQEKGEGEGDDADMERAIKLSLDPAFLPQGRAPVGGVTIRDPVSETTSKLHEVVGKGKAVVTEEQVAHSLIDLSKKKRTTDQFILVRRDQTPHDSTTGPSSQPEDDTSEKVIHESSSTSDSERTESETEAAAPKGDKDQDEVDTSTVTSGVSIPVSDPEKAHEALAGLDPEPMKEEPDPDQTSVNTYERVIDDKPESHYGSMSSMKNLDDSYNFADQFLYDKPTEDDQEKSKVREESDSTIPEYNPNTDSNLRVARLEQEMSEVNKTDHSADVLASIKSQVPTAVDKYLGTKLDDALLNILERHTADLIEKIHCVAPGPRVSQPPPKDDDQSSKKPRKSDASASKQNPALTLTGWQITDTRDAGADSSMHRSDLESEHSEQSLDDIPIQDEGNDSDTEDTDNAHIPKVLTTTWFKPILESERPATPEPEWTIPPNDFPEPENNWANTYATTYKVPEENKLQRKTYDIGSFIKWFCRRTGKKKLCKADLEGPAFNLVKAFHKNNLVVKKLIRTGCIQIEEIYKNPTVLRRTTGSNIALYHILSSTKKDLDVSSDRDKEQRIALSNIQAQSRVHARVHHSLVVPEGGNSYINKHSESSDREASQNDRSAQCQEKDFKNLHQMILRRYVPTQISRKAPTSAKTDKTSLSPAVHMCDGTLTRVMEKLDHMVKDFHLYEYNKGMETRKWSEDDKRRSKRLHHCQSRRFSDMTQKGRSCEVSEESFVGEEIRDILDYRRLIPKGERAYAFYLIGIIRCKVRYYFPMISHNRRDLPRGLSLVCVDGPLGDSDPSQDDVRYVIGNDFLKKAQITVKDSG